MLGHAAGDAAHLALAGRTSVQQVDTAKLRDLLRKEGAVLDSAQPAAAKPAPAAPADPFAADVKTLVAKKIVDAPDYWLANATKGGQCDGARVATMLLNMARHFEPTTAATGSLQVLLKHKVLRSTIYGPERAVAGGKCGGDNIRTVIRNFVHATE
jgi:hypothetical protein